MSGSDQAAQNPWFRAKSRALSGHRGSLEISGIITRWFVNAAVPQEPLLGPIGQGVMAAGRAAGICGTSPGETSLAPGSLEPAMVATGGPAPSMGAQ